MDLESTIKTKLKKIKVPVRRVDIQDDRVTVYADISRSDPRFKNFDRVMRELKLTLVVGTYGSWKYKRRYIDG